MAPTARLRQSSNETHHKPSKDLMAKIPAILPVVIFVVLVIILYLIFIWLKTRGAHKAYLAEFGPESGRGNTPPVRNADETRNVD